MEKKQEAKTNEHHWDLKKSTSLNAMVYHQNIFDHNFDIRNAAL